MSMLDKLITRATLEKLAGTTAFRRGEESLSIGAVDRLRVTGEKIAARVEGTETYRVELRGDSGNLDYDCTCPRAADGFFCKHCVAVGLAWLAEQPSPEGSAGEAARATGNAKRRDPWQDMRAYLRSRPAEALAEMLLDVAQRDDGLYRTLLLGAERAAGGGHVEDALRRAIDDAVQVPDYVDWREARAYADGVRQVAESLRELLEPESAGMLVGLAEHMIEGIEHALEQVDDSDGYMGEIVQRLGGWHLEACAMARPDPATLAERLFRLETALPFSLLSFDPATYRRALGRKGLQRYRELAETEWAKIGPRTGRGAYDRHREAIGRIMERLAETSGDVDELVAIKSRDLSSGSRYLAIARTLAEASRADEALDWAERGLRACPERPTEELRDFLVAAYLKRKRNDEALALTWAQFEERPGLDTYRKLHGVAGKLGIWTEQRSRALGWLERAIENEGKSASPGRRGPSTPDCSLRVSIALWEKDLDAAWTAAQRGVCTRALLIELAGKLEAGRPDDAVSLYRRVVLAFAFARVPGAKPVLRRAGHCARDAARSVHSHLVATARRARGLAVPVAVALREPLQRCLRGAGRPARQALGVPLEERRRRGARAARLVDEPHIVGVQEPVAGGLAGDAAPRRAGLPEHASNVGGSWSRFSRRSAPPQEPSPPR